MGINIGAIEREIREMWKGEASGDENADKSVTRARVLNLLVYNDHKHEIESIGETLYEVTERHPSRALVMNVNRMADEASLDAHVTAICRAQGSRAKQVCCEQVVFTAMGKAAEDLPSAAAQLLRFDLPVFLWWRAMPDLDDYVFSRLVTMTDRVIIDSGECEDPRKDYRKLAETLREHPDWSAVTDFSWQKLTSWRALFASFYDVAEYRPYLDRIDALTIEYIPGKEQKDVSARAFLLAGWLANRLGWKLDDDASAHDGDDNLFSYQVDGRQVRVHFVPLERDELPGLLASATLEVRSEPTAKFKVERTARNRLSSEAWIGGDLHASRLLTYRPSQEAELLSGELSILGHDRSYEGAMAAAAQMGGVAREKE